MKKTIKREWFAVIFSLVTFMIILRTVHDMQTAQGVGLYLSQLGGYDSRVLFDIMVDTLSVVLLALLLLTPCFLLDRRNSGSFFRLLAAYLALLPGVDLADMVHIFDPPGVFHLRQTLIEGDILNTFLAGMTEVSPVLKLWLPGFCLLMMGNRMIKNKSLNRWQNKIFWIQIPLLLGVFLFPAISSFLAFVMQYLLLIVCFDIWEGWYNDYPNMHLWGMILFGGFWLRGLYLMIEVMSTWEK